ncbi:polymorphic toxin type 34 domain-containing protein [Escherichia coli]|uniref:polymorphic toxin type 34 domain-containing protein n=1 Tax=Escherichia coli TaxID=562 RepID=UPI0031342B92
MSGKPAARQGDMTQYGGSIVQGSAGVRIGAPTGVACSVCPGGVTSGHPVNPLLGAKVLPGETDIALPGPLPFILSRTYSSYRTKTPAPVGSLGPGWKMPADIRLQLRDNTLILSDNGGRSLYFEHLFPGEDGYSRSESLWLVRGGVAKLDEGHRLAALWQALPEELRLSPHRYLATNSPQGPWWLLGWCERVPEADEVLPAPLPPYRVLTGLVDRFGRTQTFHREAAGEFSGEITGVTDGAWRHFRLVLTTQAQRAEEARQQAISGGTEPSAFPDTLPGYTEYGRDNGIRLSAVWLTHDPEYPENLPAAPLVRYGWTPRGELAVVYDRSGKQVRSFTYDDKYRGRMVAHRHTGRPEIRYRYDSDGRVTEQLNPAGLSYTYQYEKDRITITDSLDRREVLHTQGEAGLKRVVKKEHADGSVTQSQLAVYYGYDEKGRLTGERQTVHHPQTEALLWQHETRHAYNAQGLANRCIPDSLPAVEWLTYGSGYLAGMKLGDTPLVEYTRDRLHRETLRSFGRYELTTAYTPAGQLQSQHLNSLLSDRDYTWNDNGELIRISSPRQTRSYSYSTTGRLTGVHTTAANLDIRIPYATDPAGNRLPDPELHPDSTLSMWPDNRIARDAHYLYRYDRHGRLTEKTDLIPEGVIRTDDERTHRYHYDSQHRLVHYTRTQYEEPLVESRYLYDPLGRRVAKRVWRRERDLTGWMSLSRKPQVTWYGWDGDRLTTIQNDRSRIQTIYQPGSFTPLIRVETATGELAKTQRRSLADALQQSGGEDGGSVVFPPVLVQMLDRLESEILADRVSEESRRWLASCGLTVEQMQNQMDPVYTPARKIHLYHCDHRGLPLALISTEGATAWCAEYDEWGNLLNEENPHQLQQLIRLPGQQYDEESGLYYNRHRYYDPLQGRYITQDPIGLKGGWNFYQYPLNPVTNTDPLGLEVFPRPFPLPIPWPKSPAQQQADDNAAKALTKWWNDTASQRIFDSLILNNPGLALDITMIASRGNVADTGITDRVNDIINDRFWSDGKKPDRCDVLQELIDCGDISAKDAKSTQKAWNCRHSRQSNDKKR